MTIVRLASQRDKASFGDLTIEATRAAIADAAVTAVDHAWFRHTSGSIETNKDGLSIDGAGLDDTTVAAAKLLPAISPSNKTTAS